MDPTSSRAPVGEPPPEENNRTSPPIRGHVASPASTSTPSPPTTPTTQETPPTSVPPSPSTPTTTPEAPPTPLNPPVTPECCAICQEALTWDTHARLLRCNHSGFHYACAETWVFLPEEQASGRRNTCPLCRQKVRGIEFVDPRVQERYRAAVRRLRDAVREGPPPEGPWFFEFEVPKGVVYGWELRKLKRLYGASVTLELAQEGER